MRYRLNFNLDGLQLPNSEQIRILTEAGIKMETEQRKTYDEYYILKRSTHGEMTLPTLVRLSNHFTLTIDSAVIYISE